MYFRNFEDRDLAVMLMYAHKVNAYDQELIDTVASRLCRSINNGDIKIKALYNLESKISAIKYAREIHKGMTLKDAKIYVERLCE